jgi:general secretion pathway protein A
MYLSFYGLKKEPFHTTPDPNFLYLSPTHKEALGAIIYGIEQRKGFIAITGEVGVGKTTIIRAYLERPTTRKQKTIYIFNPVLSFQALLNTIFRSLDVTPMVGELPELVTQLHEILISEYRANSTVVLVIDEAQNMPVETLENLRMLSNLETVSDKLLQIVLIGQPELHHLLDDPRLKALKQRITLRANITPLTEKESQAYIEHRVNLVSRTGRPLFTRDAMKLITKQAQGIPRRLNILCDNALITGYGRQRNPVTANEVKEILADFEGGKPFAVAKWPYVAAVVLALVIGLLLFITGYMPLNVGVLDSSTKPTPESSFAAREMPSLTPASDGPDSLQSPASQTTSSSFNTGDPSPDFPKPNDSTDITGTSSSEGRLNVSQGKREAVVQGSSDTMMRSETQPSLSRSKEPIARTLGDEEQVAGLSSIPEDRPSSSQYSGQALLPIEESSDADNTTPSAPRVRLVKKGENLSKITQEIYGSDDPKYVNWVRNHNVGITDPDFILPGQQIVVPEYVKE